MSADDRSGTNRSTTETITDGGADVLAPAESRADESAAMPAARRSTRDDWAEQLRATDAAVGSRNLGGTCPRCAVPIESRLKARYDDELTARLVLVGYCHRCEFSVEGECETVSLHRA